MKETSLKCYTTSDGQTFTEGVVKDAKAAAQAHQVFLDNAVAINQFITAKSKQSVDDGGDPLTDRSCSRIRNTVNEWLQYQAEVDASRPTLVDDATGGSVA